MGFPSPTRWALARKGYAYAFSDPPHALRATQEDIHSLFRSLSQHLFNNLYFGLGVYEWATDWSSYFDAGHEWWGGFLWTIQVPTTGRFVGITASATD